MSFYVDERFNARPASRTQAFTCMDKFNPGLPSAQFESSEVLPKRASPICS